MASWWLLVWMWACTGSDPSAIGGVQPGADIDSDGDGFLASEDCDDGDADIHPDATEVCDDEDVDEDCDELVDDDDPDLDATGTTEWCRDDDGDGYGDPSDCDSYCDAPSDAWVGDATDCDDDDDASHPGATEVCDDADNDCNDEIDEIDTDGDGDGYTVCDDCDDGDPDTYPDAPETCDDGIDQDCNGLVDCEDAGCATWSTCYESDCGDGGDDDDDGLVDCADDECAGLGDCRVLVSRVKGGSLEHQADQSTWYQEGDIYWWRWLQQTCYSPTSMGGTTTFYVTTSSHSWDDWTDEWTQRGDRLIGRDLWGTVKLYEQSETVQCDWSLDSMEWNRTTSFLGEEPTTSLTRAGFATTGACGLDSTFLPAELGARSGWAYLATSGSAPWYAASNTTMGGSQPASLVGSTTATSTWVTSSRAAGGTAGGWSYSSSSMIDNTVIGRHQSWQIAAPDTVAGQSYRVEVPCGDPSISPESWYMDSDGDGYGDPDRMLVACQAPSAYVADSSDTDDTDAQVP
ncbi:MAG: MopE-related protein [Myxococcota bacterium]|nr:MopE-related protein [Myxococcota bacterium]